eukprot:8764112-Pyramimonas_sp.AAC.1
MANACVPQLPVLFLRRTRAGAIVLEAQAVLWISCKKDFWGCELNRVRLVSVKVRRVSLAASRAHCGRGPP